MELCLNPFTFDYLYFHVVVLVLSSVVVYNYPGKFCSSSKHTMSDYNKPQTSLIQSYPDNALQTYSQTIKCGDVFQDNGNFHKPPQRYDSFVKLGIKYIPVKLAYKLYNNIYHHTKLWQHGTHKYHKSPDQMRKNTFNHHNLCYFLTKSCVCPLVRIVSMRRF